jgi:hypothetical protein
MQTFTGQKETAATVAKAQRALIEQRAYVISVWGNLWIEQYDPKHSAAVDELKRLRRIFAVKQEALKCGQ